MLPVLHPGILFLTKVKRWANIFESTRPKSIIKAQTDYEDLEWLMTWLIDRKETLRFDQYKTAQPGRLYEALKTWVVCIEKKGTPEAQKSLKAIIKEEDWTKMGLTRE